MDQTQMEMQGYEQQIQIQQQQLDDINQKLQKTELYLKLKCLSDLQIKRKQLECYQEQLKQEYLEILKLKQKKIQMNKKNKSFRNNYLKKKFKKFNFKQKKKNKDLANFSINLI
ncbi:hypothetical protein pb186bvf_014306 [Paramecium bursaria]